MHCGAERDTDHFARRRVGLLNRCLYHGQNRAVNLLRILFRSCGRRREQRVLDGMVGNHATISVEQPAFVLVVPISTPACPAIAWTALDERGKGCGNTATGAGDDSSASTFRVAATPALTLVVPVSALESDIAWTSSDERCQDHDEDETRHRDDGLHSGPGLESFGNRHVEVLFHEPETGIIDVGKYDRAGARCQH